MPSFGKCRCDTACRCVRFRGKLRPHPLQSPTDHVAPSPALALSHLTTGHYALIALPPFLPLGNASSTLQQRARVNIALLP